MWKIFVIKNFWKFRNNKFRHKKKLTVMKFVNSGWLHGCSLCNFLDEWKIVFPKKVLKNFFFLFFCIYLLFRKIFKFKNFEIFFRKKKYFFFFKSKNRYVPKEGLVGRLRDIEREKKAREREGERVAFGASRGATGARNTLSRFSEGRPVEKMQPKCDATRKNIFLFFFQPLFLSTLFSAYFVMRSNQINKFFLVKNKRGVWWKMRNFSGVRRKFGFLSKILDFIFWLQFRSLDSLIQFKILTKISNLDRLIFLPK